MNEGEKPSLTVLAKQQLPSYSVGSRTTAELQTPNCCENWQNKNVAAEGGAAATAELLMRGNSLHL